jgi:altronate dehydratase
MDKSSKELNKNELVNMFADIKVIASEFKNFSKNFEEFKKNNKEDHDELASKQDYTNGDVKDLKFWKKGLMSAWGVITLLFPTLGFYYVRDIQENQHEVIMAEVTAGRNTAVEELNRTISEEVNKSVIDVLSKFNITVHY